MVDISRDTSGVSLPADLSDEIWANVVESSTIMSAARQIRLPGAGAVIHQITADAVAGWVAETAEKPVSRATLANKTMTPYKLAVIEPFSNEFRRDLPGLYAELARRLPFALAKKFDETVYGVGAAPGGNFDQLSTTTTTQTVDATDTLGDLIAAYNAVVAEGGDIDRWIASAGLVGLLISANAATDSFDLTSSAQVASVFGAPVVKTRASMPSGTIGYAGDFQADAVYGTVEGVQVSINDSATLTDGDGSINLWQQNMFAIRAEIEVGFRVTDADRFVALEAAASS